MDAFNRARNFWESMNPSQKTNFAILAVVFAATFTLVFTWARMPNYKPLYTDLSSKDASAIKKKLDEQKIPCRLADNGQTILVPQKLLYETRLQIAGSGLPESGSIGFELFDKVNLQTSEFIENVNYVRALQGELSRTITGIDEIKESRVLLNLPKESLFIEDQAFPSASVMLSLKTGKGLAPEQVQSIAFLVASSVKNLKPENVTIVDEKGNLLYSPEFSGGSYLGASQFQVQKNFNRELEHKVQGMFDKIYGPGKSLVKVAVEMDFDKQTIEKESYLPVLKNQGIVRSEQSTSEVYNEVAGTPTPAAPRTTTGGRGPSYDQRNTVRNYELNKSKEQKVVAPGKIKRITCGVFLDKSDPTTPISAEDIKTINEVLETSIGIDRARGDLVKIGTLAFNNKIWKEQELAMKEEQKKENVYNIIKIASPAGAVLLFIIFYMLLLRRVAKIKATTRPMPREAPMMMDESHPMVRETAPIPGRLPPEEEAEEDIIKKLADQDPKKIASILESLITESES